MTLVELPLVLPPAVAGIGLLAAFGAHRALAARRRIRVHADRGRAGGRLRRRPVLRATGDRRLRGARPDARRRVARRSERAAASRSSASRCRSRAAGSAPALALSFARGIGEFGATIMFAGSLQRVDPDAPARDLRRVRASTSTSRSRSARTARRSSARSSSFAQTGVRVARSRLQHLRFRFAPSTSTLALEVGAETRCARRALRRRQDRPSCARSPGSRSRRRADHARRRGVVRRAARLVRASRSAGSGSSSRSTRSSRT